MTAEGQEQQARYVALKRHRAEVLQTLRFFDSLGKALSTWEREVLAEADKSVIYPEITREEEDRCKC